MANEPAIPPSAPNGFPPLLRSIGPRGLLLALLGCYVLYRARLIVEIGLMALIIATILERPIAAMERRGLSRKGAVWLVHGTLLASLIAGFVIAAPAALREVDRLRAEEPARLQTLALQWQASADPLLAGPGHRLVLAAIHWLQAPVMLPTGLLLDAATRIVLVVVGALACLAMSTAYLLEKDLIKGLLLHLARPPDRDRVARLWDMVEHMIGGWVRSRLILGAIVGLITLPVFAWMRLPYWPLLSALAAITEPVPILGPWIGGVPAVLLTLAISPLRATLVAGFILLRQFTVDAVLVPRVTRETIGLSPLTVFAAVFAGTHLFGPLGALLAIPLAAAVQIIIADAVATRGQTSQFVSPGWHWVHRAWSSPPDRSSR